MSDLTMNGVAGAPSPRPHMDTKPHAAGAIAFILVLVAGLGFAAYSIATDISNVGEQNIATGAFVMLGLALLIALGFEFVNGFHDTANAVATVIYTHSHAPGGRGGVVGLLQPGLACSSSSGAVAFGSRYAAAGRTDTPGRQRARVMR